MVQNVEVKVKLDQYTIVKFKFLSSNSRWFKCKKKKKNYFWIDVFIPVAIKTSNKK